MYFIVSYLQKLKNNSTHESLYYEFLFKETLMLHFSSGENTKGAVRILSLLSKEKEHSSSNKCVVEVQIKKSNT